MSSRTHACVRCHLSWECDGCLMAEEGYVCSDCRDNPTTKTDEMRETLEEIDDYLTRQDSIANAIYTNSLLHLQVKRALGRPLPSSSVRALKMLNKETRGSEKA